MVDPTDKDTKHIEDQSRGTEGYHEYTKEKEKGKVNQLDVGNEKDLQNSGSNNPSLYDRLYFSSYSSRTNSL